MLIVCCGPDRYRALARARELEAAFKQKHDPEGRSIERLPSGKDGVEAVIEKSAGASLFSSRRFLRADGILSNCPKIKHKAMIDALSRDVESMIVVSVEEEKPAASVLKIFDGLPKCIVNEYPLLTGKAFLTWSADALKSLGFDTDPIFVQLAEACEGDSWRFINEATKLAAGANREIIKYDSTESAYDLTDRILRQGAERFAFVERSNFGYSESSVLVQQTVSAIRVRDRDAEGLVPFVVRKLQNMQTTNPELLLGAGLEMIFLQRSGMCDEQESSELIP